MEPCGARRRLVEREEKRRAEVSPELGAEEEGEAQSEEEEEEPSSAEPEGGEVRSGEKGLGCLLGVGGGFE